MSDVDTYSHIVAFKTCSIVLSGISRPAQVLNAFKCSTVCLQLIDNRARGRTYLEIVEMLASLPLRRRRQSTQLRFIVGQQVLIYSIFRSYSFQRFISLMYVLLVRCSSFDYRFDWHLTRHCDAFAGGKVEGN